MFLWHTALANLTTTFLLTKIMVSSYALTKNIKKNPLSWNLNRSIGRVSLIVDEARLRFKNKFLTNIDKTVPFKLVCLTHNTAPWITNELLQRIHDRNHSWNDTKKSTTPKTHTSCSIKWQRHFLGNRAHNLETQLKTGYFTTQLQENQKNPKKLWQILKSLGTSSTTSSSNIFLKINDRICFKLKVAERYNSYFSTVPLTNLHKTNHSYGAWLICLFWSSQYVDFN